jgi:outer membrane protein assembly factor BamB
MRVVSKCLLSLTLLFALGHTASAATTVKLSPANLHPNLPLTVTGAGFGDGEAVDVYIDQVDIALTVSSATGTVSSTVQISAGMTPGTHYITAIGRKSGDAAQAAFNVTTPWPYVGFGVAGRGWNPWENTISPGNVNTLGLLWEAPTDPVYSSPAVAYGKVYVALPSGLKALSATTGQVLWTNQLVGSFYSSPAVAGNTIYVASNAGGVYAVNNAGTKLWSALTTVDFVYASPGVVNGVVYIGSSTGTMYALNAATGATIWSYASSGEAIYSSAAGADGIVYFGSYSGNVYALNASTGTLVWTYTTASQIRATPAVVNGVVYISSFDSYLYALVAEGANGGTLLWKDETDYNVWSSPAVADNAVYIASAGGTVYAYDPRTGATKWSFATGSTIYSDLSVANGVLYVGTNDGGFYALNDATGAVLWTGNLGDPAWGRPLISDGVVYTNSQQGKTLAFALQAGNNAVPRGARPPALASLRPDYGLRVGG